MQVRTQTFMTHMFIAMLMKTAMLLQHIGTIFIFFLQNAYNKSDLDKVDLIITFYLMIDHLANMQSRHLRYTYSQRRDKWLLCIFS